MFDDAVEIYQLVKSFVGQYLREDYSITDGERVKFLANAHFQRHPERAALNGRVWRKNNPEKWSRLNRANQHKRRSAEGRHTAKDIERIYDEQSGRCAYCGIPLNGKYHVDHIHPLSRGGTNNPDNLACACSACNLSKHDKLLSEWKPTLDSKTNQV